jgi:hypothetical protein
MTTHLSTEPQAAHGGRRPGDDEPACGPDDRPGLSPWMVVAAWAVLLGLLAGVSAGFGNNIVVLEISGGAAGLVLVLAGAVWLHQRLRPYRVVLSLPTRTGGVFLFAVSAAVAWFGLAFGEFMPMIAAVPFTAAVGLEIAARRARRTP